MFKLTIPVPGGIMLEATATDEKDVVKQLTFWGGIPKTCPVDGYPTQLRHRTTKTDDDYYEIVSTGPTPWARKLGQYKAGGGLFFQWEGENPWSYYDRDAGESVTRELGSYTPLGQPQKAQTQEGEPPVTDDGAWERSAEATEAHARLVEPESVSERQQQHGPRRLTADEARKLHAKLGAIGVPKEKHYRMASVKFKREVTSFEQLTIGETVALADYAERWVKQEQRAA